MLDEHAAWGYVERWRCRADAVRLVPGPVVDAAFPQCYEWVEFRVTKTKKPWSDVQSAHVVAQATTELTAVLHALSSCAGFAGHENGAFWRRVFADSAVPIPEPAVSDARLFFDEGLHTTSTPAPRRFPRFRLVVETGPTSMNKAQCTWVETFLRVFFGLHERDARVKPSPEFLETMRALKPHVVEHRRCLGVDIGLAFTLGAVATVTPILSKLVADLTARCPLAQTNGNGNAANGAARCHSTPATFAQGLRLCDIAVDGIDNVDAKKLDALRVLLDTPELPVRALAVNSVPASRAHVISFFRSAVLPTGPATLHALEHLTIVRSSMSEEQFQGLCCALPCTRSLLSLSIQGGQFADQYALTSDLDWAWFGHALFHPAAPTSRLRHLELALLHMTERQVQLLRLAQRGANAINWLAARGNRRARIEESVRLQVRVRAGSRIVASATGKKAHTPLLETSADQDFETCEELDNPEELGELVHVIVPGCGHGWVAREAVLAVGPIAVTPQSHLRSLQAMVLDPTNEGAGVLAEFVEILGGPKLEALDVSQFVYVDDDAVLRIRRACPNLRTLGLNYNGAVWRTLGAPAVAPTGSTLALRELALRCSREDEVAALLDILRAAHASGAMQLTALRLAVPMDTSEALRHELGRALLGEPTFRHLRWLHWYQCRGTTRAQKLTYEERRRHSRQWLGLDTPQAKTPSARVVAAAPMALAQRLAFLSVVRALAKAQEPMGSLDSLAAALILQFAGGATVHVWCE